MLPDLFTTDAVGQQLHFVYADDYLIVKGIDGKEYGNLTIGDQKALVGFILNLRPDLKAYFNRLAWIEVNDTTMPKDALQVLAYDETTKRQYVAEHDSKALINDWFNTVNGGHLDNVTHYLPLIPNP